ncbi:beta-fructofuranosidase, cell wall isozyme-like [Bidens hawaiensis]|uniref:beta-fructofuranosidase, cell wall isozyme-like n=1 Tax=Bidens hawaiensis TaxID=980011 RepID=UPI00404B2A99
MYWGHSVSYDLVNWFILETALTPHEHYDAQGFFTGSNLAFPKNTTDPLLKDWTKWAANPILIPENDTPPDQFRDPSTAWMGPDGRWRMVIGGKINHYAATILYHSSNGLKWTRARKPFHSSSSIDMWECPNIYPVNTFHVLKTSYARHDWYVLGKYDPKVDRFVLITDDFSLGNRHLRYDYGVFYASKSFYNTAKNRRVLWAWVPEVSDKPESDAIKRGWSGLQSFPRTIRLSDNQKQLVQWPVEEIMKLRGKHVSMQNRVLKGGSLLEVPGVRGSQADAEVWFSLPDLTDAESINPDTADPQLLCNQKNAHMSGTLGPFGLLVLASKDLIEQAAVFFRVFKDPKKFCVIMCSDQTRSSIAQVAKDDKVYGAFLNVDPIKDKISLRTLIDHSIVESFGGHGLACITARVVET